MQLNEIFNDARGSIKTLTGDMNWAEVTVFNTNEGFARGGCIHAVNDEYTCVIEGRVEYHIGDEMYIMKPGDSCVIPKNSPHYFLSLTDSIVLEWGASPEEKAVKHAATRAVVDEINAGVGK